MKLHSDKITERDIYVALRDPRIASDVHPVTLETGRSQSRRYRYEIQLGTYDQTSGPTKSRHYKNSGTSGASNVWAATYAEWGWFIARLFAIDPEATFGPYKGQDSFNAQTDNAFVLDAS